MSTSSSPAVCHLRVAIIDQEIYGLPKWLQALQSALLIDCATLFLRRYYQNGTLAGFIMYMTDAAQSEDFVNDLGTAMKNSKWPGSFRNFFMLAPSGKKGGFEVAAEDEFGVIKNISRDDQLAMLRIPFQLMDVVPQNHGIVGSIRDAAQVSTVNELYLARLLQINDWLREEVVRFRAYEIPSSR